MTFSLLYPDPRVARFALRCRSESDPARTRDGWSCECWPFLKHDKCKHVRFAAQVLAALKAQEVPA